MNTRNLSLILQNYISQFDNPKAKSREGESYKWYAVHDFQSIFDINAPDFAAMLKKVCKATANLIDNHTQPFTGLVTLAEKNGEAENIREMFRLLYAEDRGNLNIRQAKITAFLKSCDELLKKHYPSSYLFKNDQRSAMAYLWFYDPDHNFMCKTTEARYLADALDFYDDWGTYASFKLEVYDRFCNMLIEEFCKDSAFMDVHRRRFQGHEAEMHPDQNLHILTFDIIYCAKTYGLYSGMVVKEHTAEERHLYQQKKEKAIELAAKLTEAEKKLVLLQEGTEKAEALIKSGAVLRHKILGTGELKGLIEYKGKKYMEILFPCSGAMKKFEITNALGNGFITLDSPDFQAFIERYGAVLKQDGNIEKQVKDARSALEPYISFLD